MKTKIEFIKIDYDVIPKEIFDKYGAKPFEIAKRKMRDKDNRVWNNINYFDAQKEAKKLGYRLLTIQEMLVLLEYYKKTNDNVSYRDKEFLGIEELSYDEDVCYEWIYNLDNVAFGRGGYWNYASNAGVFSLFLSDSPAGTDSSLGFRCVR